MNKGPPQRLRVFGFVDVPRRLCLPVGPSPGRFPYAVRLVRFIEGSQSTSGSAHGGRPRRHVATGLCVHSCVSAMIGREVARRTLGTPWYVIACLVYFFFYFMNYVFTRPVGSF